MTVFIGRNGTLPEDLPRPMGVSARLAGLLYERGCRTEEDMEKFLHPGFAQLHDPFLMNGMEDAVRLIRAAIKDKRRIAVYGDYDADGVCATAMLISCIEGLGGDVFFRIPSRHLEGYGLNMAAADGLIESGAGLVITVDNGIKANAEIQRLKERGAQVVVTDHHKPGAVLPEADAIICHTVDGDTYPNSNICGAGTAYKLVCALTDEKEALKYLPLAGLATAADAVPLIGENRAMVALALEMINRRECCEGLNAIAASAGEKRGKGGYNSRDLVFQFAPRINAAGRMEDAELSVKLLLETDAQSAAKLASGLNALNERRKQDEENIVRSAYDMVESMDITHRRAIVLASEGWNHGVAGIAASRVAERYCRPTILFGRDGDTLVGSARSVKGVDLYTALAACEDCFIRFGGHEFAAGITMSAARLDELIMRFDAALASGYSEDVLIPCRTYEVDAELSDMTLRLAEEIELMAPFGEGNPQPTFCTRAVAVTRVGRFGSKGYVRATGVKNDCYAELLGFSLGPRFDEIMDMDRADIIYVPNINDYMGVRRLQLIMSDIRRCPVEDIPSYVEQRKDKFLNAICANIRYNDKCAYMPLRECGDEDVVRLLNAGASGTAVLCFTPEGAQRMLALIRDSGSVDVLFGKNPRSPAAYNTVVLAPVLDELTLCRFSNIVCYDIRVPESMGKMLAASAPNALMYAHSSPVKSRAYEEVRMDRERFITYYRAMAASGEHYNMAAAADCLVKAVGGRLCMAKLALGIMEELGFITDRSRVVFNGEAPRRELSESRIFAALARLNEE